MPKVPDGVLAGTSILICVTPHGRVGALPAYCTGAGADCQSAAGYRAAYNVAGLHFLVAPTHRSTPGNRSKPC